MISPQLMAAAAVEPWHRGSGMGMAMRGQLVSMADHWSLMTTGVPLISSLAGGEGRVEKQVEPQVG